MPRNIVYVLHLTLHENAIIDWGRIIFSEISFQLSNLKNTWKFYMTSYIIFDIAYFPVFEDLLRERIIDFKVESVFSWYPSLWRHKCQYYFYPVHTNFILEFKKLVFCPTTSSLSLEATTFLARKGFFETTEYLNIIRLYGCEDKHFFLLFYILL